MGKEFRLTRLSKDVILRNFKPRDWLTTARTIWGILHDKPRIADKETHAGLQKNSNPPDPAGSLTVSGWNRADCPPETSRAPRPSLMERQDSPQPCVLYQSDNGAVVCLDIPRSIEEAQSPPGEVTCRRLFSTSPLLVPFETPESRHGDGDQSTALTPSAQLAILMTSAAVQDALQHLYEHFPGPYCLPRVTRPSSNPNPSPESYFTPHGSHALEGSIQETRDELVSTAPQFDLILVDPPWPNRSVKRKRGGYSICRSHGATRDLLSLIPAPARLAPGGVLAVWVTNSHSATELLTAKDGLFAQWGLEQAAEWIWLKVTAHGEPMVDVESTWRKPWERLLIAKRKGDEVRPLVDRKVIVAVPDVHSRKPNLRPLFDDVLGPGYEALEVFARHLTAGWWSWGNEATMFQAESNWTRYAKPQDVDLGCAVEPLDQ